MTSRVAMLLLSVLGCTRLCLLASVLEVPEGQSVNLSCLSTNCSGDLFWRKETALIAKRLNIRGGKPESKSENVTLYADGTLNIHSVTFPGSKYHCSCGGDRVDVRLEVYRTENSEGTIERDLTLAPQTEDLALPMNFSLIAVSAAGLLGITVFVLLYVCGGIRLPINRSPHVDNGSSGMAELELIDELFNTPDYDPEMYLHPTAAGDDSSIAPADREDLDSLGYHVPTSLSTLSSSDEDFFPVANARNVLRRLPRMEAEENVYDTEMYLHPTQTPRGEIDIDGEDNQATNATRTTTPTTTPASTPTTTYISQMPRVAAEHNVYYSFDEFQNN